MKFNPIKTKSIKNIKGLSQFLVSCRFEQENYYSDGNFFSRIKSASHCIGSFCWIVRERTTAFTRTESLFRFCFNFQKIADSFLRFFIILEVEILALRFIGTYISTFLLRFNLFDLLEWYKCIYRIFRITRDSSRSSDISIVRLAGIQIRHVIIEPCSKI